MLQPCYRSTLKLAQLQQANLGSAASNEMQAERGGGGGGGGCGGGVGVGCGREAWWWNTETNELVQSGVSTEVTHLIQKWK